MTTSILIAGMSGSTHVGSTFLRSAHRLNCNARLIDSEIAYQAPRALKSFNWRFRGKYPSKMRYFGAQIIEGICLQKSQLLLTTGIAPISYSILNEARNRGVKCVNFLTDDPWNSAHFAPWFFKALPCYDIVFSPRRDNIEDLKQQRCSRVEYLPFAFEPEQFHTNNISDRPNEAENKADIIFAGGGDRDRLPYIHALIQAGLNVHLYGSYWERYPQTRKHARGQADLPVLRQALSSAKIGLCLVRRANRDGHCMRTFEVPAVGTCMLTEDTREHREIFGAEGEAVLYFSDLEDMVRKACWLLEHESERERLAQTAHKLVNRGKHTYCERLKTILSFADL